jgi:hypothetical protein
VTCGGTNAAAAAAGGAAVSWPFVPYPQAPRWQVRNGLSCPAAARPRPPFSLSWFSCWIDFLAKKKTLAVSFLFFRLCFSFRLVPAAAAVVPCCLQSTAGSNYL